jgi:phosphatidate cytidylyltransferase
LILIGFIGSASLVHASLNNGPGLLLFVLVTVWLADTGGYFAGKQFGKHALAREISPNKTWEGALGAIVLSSVWAVLFYFTAGNPTLSLAAWLLISVFIVMISIVGDLFESVFKRCFKVKDSGQLLPGHGGMLDRIDSLLAAVPVFAAVMTVMGAL